jgi:hypothetical protein
VEKNYGGKEEEHQWLIIKEYIGVTISPSASSEKRSGKCICEAIF